MEDAQLIPAVPTYSTLAIFSLIFAVLAWTLLPILGMALANLNVMNFIAMPLTGSVIASICGWMAQKKIRQSNGSLLGGGLAKAGRIMAYTQYLLVLILFVFAFLSFFLPRQSLS